MKKLMAFLCKILIWVVVLGVAAMFIARIPGPVIDVPTLSAPSGDMILQQQDKAGVCTGGLWQYIAGLTEFLESAAPAAMIPGLNENFVPQGLDISKDNGFLYVSGYFKNKEANPFPEDGNPSAIVILDRNGSMVWEYVLYHENGKPFTGHLGGIAVTEDTVFFSASKITLDNGTVNYRIGAIPLESFVSGSHMLTVESFYSVPVQPSYLNYSEGVLWVGNFYMADSDDYPAPDEIGMLEGRGGYLFGYDLSGGAFRLETVGSGYPMPDSDKVFSLPEKVKGMAMLPDGRIVLSCSYGRLKLSRISVFDPKDGTEGEIMLNGSTISCRILPEAEKTIVAPPLSEGITVDDNGDLFILFESGASNFDGYTKLGIYSGIFRTDWIWKMELE